MLQAVAEWSNAGKPAGPSALEQLRISTGIIFRVLIEKRVVRALAETRARGTEIEL